MVSMGLRITVVGAVLVGAIFFAGNRLRAEKKSTAGPSAEVEQNDPATIEGGGILSDDRDNQAILLELGYLHLKEKQWEEALPLLTRASRQDPGNMQIHMDIGYAQLAANDPVKAAEEFTLVAKAPGAFQAQARSALKIIADAKAAEGSDAGSRRRRLIDQGYDALKKGNKKLSRSKFNQALRMDPKNTTVLKELGYMNLGEERLHEAALNFEAVREQNPEDYVAALQLGYLYQRLKKGAESEEAFRAATASGDVKIRSAAEAALKAGRASAEKTAG